MLKGIFCNLVFLFFCVNTNVVWAANLVINGDFEDGSTGWTEWSSPGPWVGDAVFKHDYANLCDIWIPVPYPYDGTHTHCQHLGDDNVHGGIYQVINVTKGRKYKVSGKWSGGIGDDNPSNTIVGWFEVVVYAGAIGPSEIDAAPGVDDVTIAKKEHSGPNVYFFGWEEFSGTFTAKSNQVTLALKTGKVGEWDPIAAYHDNISVYDFSWPMFVPATTGKKIP